MTVFISGATGYLGRALGPALAARGHRVLALARPGSEHRVPQGAETVTGDALDQRTFAAAVPSGATFVQLTGVAHPAPWKEAQFRAVDLVSARASAQAARDAGVAHFVYVSVAQPAPVMQSYIRVRSECEAFVQDLGLTATILRPWYILGPGHWWPAALRPAYKLLEAIPATRVSAQRLGLVSLQEMVHAMLWAVENPPERTRLLEVPEIRGISSRWR